MKLHAKKSLSLHRQAISRTGGGPKPPSPSKEVVELVELIPLEFQEVFNEYDSNGPPTNVKTEVPETEGEQSCEVPCRPESTSAVLIEMESSASRTSGRLLKIILCKSLNRLCLINLGRKDLMNKSVDYLYNNIKLCSNHFEDGQFTYTNKQVSVECCSNTIRYS
ncbi:uncharacterized protein [Periplaneta americana]|uniref:uncharacterized protein isoform X2 n=1 Tax=Periplaneta americana TaxID=6978 RepID=UPI0037E74FC2